MNKEKPIGIPQIVKLPLYILAIGGLVKLGMFVEHARTGYKQSQVERAYLRGRLDVWTTAILMEMQNKSIQSQTKPDLIPIFIEKHKIEQDRYFSDPIR